MISETISHYYLLSKLGAGGMGEVYLAEDTHLGRKVAIKFLPSETVADERAKKRLIREAQAAATLDHPNICAIHEVGEQAGSSFIVMQYIEGETLADKIKRGPLDLRQVLDIAVQAADALAEAHSRGIIHRDIKPQNIMLTPREQVKVLDFGLAKIVRGTCLTDSEAQTESLLTESGAMIGTVPYMSPEQVKGEALDARSDIFSFGIVLYEMVTGRQPFQAESPAAIISAILTRDPPPLARYANEVPEALQWIVTKALRKDRDERYQTAKELFTDLRDLKQRLEFESQLEQSTIVDPRPAKCAGNAAAAPATEPTLRTGELTAAQTSSTPGDFIGRIKQNKKALGVIAAAVVIASATALFLYLKPAPALTEKDTILIGDFVNTTGDAVFDVTLKQALAVQLEQSPFFHIFSDEGIRETLRYMGRSPNERVTKDVAREICLRQNIKALLAGSISNLGSHYVILLEAINAQTGDAIAREQVEADSKEKVLSALGKAVTSLREKLGESLRSIQKNDVPIEQATISSLEAFQAFSLGFDQHVRGRSREAIPFYKRAIALDPDSPRAHVNLAVVYGNIRQFKLAAESAQKAFELRERASENEKLAISAYYSQYVTGDIEKRLEETELLKRTYPRYMIARLDLAAIYGRLGQHEKGVEEAREAIRLNPYPAMPYLNLVNRLIALNRFEEARTVIEQAKARNPDRDFRSNLYRIAFLRGDREEMQRQVESPPSGLLNEQALAAASSGQLRKARLLGERAVDSERRRDLRASTAGFVSRLALAHALSGSCQQMREEAAKSLEIERERDSLSDVALALALCGETGQAQSLIEELARRFPDTFVKTTWIPMIRATIEINQNNPARAIELLKVAGRYELSNEADLLPAYVRGLAYLRGRMGVEARAEFQKILDHRGVVGYLPTYPLARLGLARAAALAGDTATSRKAYQDFFELWKDADSDMPVLQQARQEYENLK